MSHDAMLLLALLVTLILAIEPEHDDLCTCRRCRRTRVLLWL